MGRNNTLFFIISPPKSLQDISKNRISMICLHQSDGMWLDRWAKGTAVTSAVQQDRALERKLISGVITLLENWVCVSACEWVQGNPHLMQAPIFYLIYAVDHKSRNHGCSARDVVCQYALQTERE